MTNNTGSDEELVEFLAELEKQLETPVVPGEMYDWVERGEKDLNQLSETYAAHVKSSHESQYEAIIEQDSEQITRMEKFREEDASLLEEIDRLGEAFAKLKKLVNAAEEAPQRDEGELEDLLPKVTGEALVLIIRIRMHENAIDTWYVEAFQRDRGVAD
mgnify:CR=1 FL=1